LGSYHRLDRQPDYSPVHSCGRGEEVPDQIEKWAEDYIVQLLDLCAELGVKIVPMFWGVAFGWELATGYPGDFGRAAISI
jgi:hypothetical protein